MPGHHTSAAAAAPSAYGESDHARMLVPVENICTRLPADEEKPLYRKGMHRERYLSEARNGVWGEIYGASCGGGSLVKQDEQGTHVYPVLCDMWSCPLCGPRKSRWLRRELGLAVERMGLTSFWTLTVWTETCTPQESSILITGWWKTLAMRLRRKYGKFSFVWIMEHTQAGYAHLHLLCSLHIDQQELRDTWEEITGGSWRCSAEPSDSGRAAAYITKYCTKQSQQRLEPGYEHLQGRRFFSKSRDVVFASFRGVAARTEALNEDTGEIVGVSDYQRVDTPYWVLVRQLVAGGLVVDRKTLAGVPSAHLIAAHRGPEE